MKLPKPIIERHVRPSDGFRNLMIGLYPDQAAELFRAVQEHAPSSVGVIADQVFSLWLPRRYGEEWPTMHRNPRRRGPLMDLETKVLSPKGGQYVYGFLINSEQQRVLRRVLNREGNPYGGLAGIMETAFGEVWEELYGRPWPHHERQWEPGNRNNKTTAPRPVYDNHGYLIPE